MIGLILCILSFAGFYWEIPWLFFGAGILAVIAYILSRPGFLSLTCTVLLSVFFYNGIAEQWYAATIMGVCALYIIMFAIGLIALMFGTTLGGIFIAIKKIFKKGES